MSISPKAWKDTLREELTKGGKESPCPFCGLPRVKRSDYVRCSPCGINWMDGETLSRDPRAERLAKFLSGAAATAIKKAPGREDGQKDAARVR